MSELNPNHSNQLPETAKDPFDEFSFDELMQMDMDSPTTTVTPTPEVSTTDKVDFDNLFGSDDTQALSATDQLTPVTNAHQDEFADTLSQLDSLNGTPPTHDFVGQTPSTTALSQPDTSNTAPTMPETTGINPMDMVSGIGAAGVAGATAATLANSNTVNNVADNTKEKSKSAFGGLLDKKDNPVKPKKEKLFKTKTTTMLNTTPKKNNKLLPLILGLLVLGGIGAWLFSSILDKAPEPKPVAAKPVNKPAPAPVAQPTSAVTMVTADSTVLATSAPMATVVATSASTVTATATSGTATTTPNTETKTTGADLIKPEEILATPIPEDPALAKEQMDKLADQSARLAEQEKMMEDQLKMTKELSDKKAERIALLEQQIAQLEAQKGQAKP